MEPPVLLPRPAHLESRPGSWRLGPEATLWASPGAGAAARLARELLAPATGFTLAPGDARADLRLVLEGDGPSAEGGPDPARVGPTGGSEAYRLSVTPEAVTLSAAGPAGLANGLQTLRQLLGPDALRPAPVRGAAWEVACVEIEDAPRFAWRGVHLDVSRHFLPMTFVRRMVDLLALHKLNVLHLHLNDDQGWRFPSAAYPRLVEVGSWRRGTAMGWRGRDGLEATPHGGHYRPEELTDLVAYAAGRNVLVLPEIDLPGHAGAVLAAYPERGNGTGPYEVCTNWGINRQVLNLEPATLEFCTTVLGEVADLFPSPFIHVGGDEVPKAEWRASPAAQARRKDLGLDAEDQLQHWFTLQLNDFLLGIGRRLVGWDEILEGGEPPEGAVVMSWRGVDGGVAAARVGRDVVMCPEVPTYLDHYQSDDPAEPLAIHGRNTLADVCAFDPVVPGLDGTAAERVLGSQVQLWTEYMPDPRAVEYMAFPRTSAFADAVWAPRGDDPGQREQRVVAHLGRLEVLDVNYRPPAGPLPWQQGGQGRRRRPGPEDTGQAG